jgi:hypothetical protein
LRVKVCGIEFGLSRGIDGALLFGSDDLNPAFDDLGPDALEPADQLVDHVKQYPVTAWFEAVQGDFGDHFDAVPWRHIVG